MEQKTVKITGKRRLRIYDRLMLLGQLVVSGEIPFWEFMRVSRAWIEKHVPDALSPEEEQQDPQTDMAELRRAEVERVYRELGETEAVFKDIQIPKPELSNTQIRKGRNANKELFWVSPYYEAFMRAVDQGDHWSAQSTTESSWVGWESRSNGYWIWVEVALSCPRLNPTDCVPDTFITDLVNEEKQLLSLEEYVVVWWFKFFDGTLLDLHAIVRLRTCCHTDTPMSASGSHLGVVICLGTHRNSLPAGHLGWGARAMEAVRALSSDSTTRPLGWGARAMEAVRALSRTD